MGKLRAVAASYWTALALGLVLLVLHVWWYKIDDRVTGGEVVSGFGDALVALGVWVASGPYIRAGIAGLVQAGLPVYGAGFWSSDETLQAHRAKVAAERPHVTRDVWAERVIAVVVVIVGTLLNGYGPLVARLFGMRVG